MTEDPEKKEKESRQLKAHEIRTCQMEAVGTLAGGIAHELNNLLTIFAGKIYLLKKYLAPNNFAYNTLMELEQAMQQSKDLSKLIVSFSKGSIPVTGTISISGLLQSVVVSFLKTNTDNSRIKSYLHVHNNLWHIKVDEGQISRVINNLLLNAKEAMSSEGIIDVRAENFLKTKDTDIPLTDGCYIKITISDNGTGICKENLNKIFMPFFTTRPKGHGLGLATAYSIVKKHNGFMDVESEPGKGTCFYIYLPASVETIPSANCGESICPPDGKGKILLVDDDISRNDIGEILGSLGFTVDYAVNGNEAIERYKCMQSTATPYDVVIIGLARRGGADGTEAVGELLKINPHAKAIAAYGYSNEEAMSNYANYGFKAATGKPYMIGELYNTINRLINNKG
ncbi:MAG: hypothetical protein HQK89_02945 [Nitrospirae bacterium]|nr:hypothetical protein [Nitrospirota bacterium]